MATSAQINANRANAQSSTGPRTDEGKLRVSRNAVSSGLFSYADFVHPDETGIYAEFCAAYLSDLSPATALEHTYAAEVIHAAWKLRRCSVIESAGVVGENADRTLQSVDRARAAAHRILQCSLAELRRVQTERLYRAIALPQDFDAANLGQASCRDLKPADLAAKQATQREAIAEAGLRERVARQRLTALSSMESSFAKQTQSAPAAQPTQPDVLIPRGAPCTCGSGEKYKRCCGKDAPPVLNRAA